MLFLVLQWSPCDYSTSVFFFFFSCLYLTWVGTIRFGIILSDLKWRPLFLLFLSPSQLFFAYRLQEISDRGRRNQYFAGKELQVLPVWSTQKCISTPEMQSTGWEIQHEHKIPEQRGTDTSPRSWAGLASPGQTNVRKLDCRRNSGRQIVLITL